MADKNVVFNSEKEYVKHILWKDFECVKGEVSKIVDSMDIFSPADLISYVHISLADVSDYVKRLKR